MRRANVAALALVLALTGSSICAPSSQARKRASAAQSRAMWQVVDSEGKCIHWRGVVSTVKSRYSWGTVVIADRNCGNGQYVLKRRKGTRRWQIVGAGSDWGFPDRCADDLRKIGRRVYRDLFPGDPNCP